MAAPHWNEIAIDRAAIPSVGQTLVARHRRDHGAARSAAVVHANAAIVLGVENDEFLLRSGAPGVAPPTRPQGQVAVATAPGRALVSEFAPIGHHGGRETLVLLAMIRIEDEAGGESQLQATEHEGNLEAVGRAQHFAQLQPEQIRLGVPIEAIGVDARPLDATHGARRLVHAARLPHDVKSIRCPA